MDRRKLLTAGAAAMVAVPATTGKACWFQEPDSELIELGKRFAAVTKECDAANAAFEAIYDPVTAMGDRLCAGIPEGAQQKAIRQRLSDEADPAFGEADPAFGEAEQALFDAWDRRRDVFAAIAAIPATTMAGLAVKAAVIRQQRADLWEEDVCEPIVRLVDDICAMAGK